jgi:CheY-like chemotaxis protein
MIDYKQLIEYTKDLKILYAEDDEKTRDIIINYFKMLFKDVVAVCDGLEALNKYKESDGFDLVFLDIEMPKCSGIEVASKIKDINKSQKIVFLTAFDEENYIKSAIDIKADEYIYKPIVEEEFIDKMYNLLK